MKLGFAKFMVCLKSLETIEVLVVYVLFLTSLNPTYETH